MLSVFWFRRDLRLEDNTGLFHALQSGNKVLPIFIFDTDILNDLKPDDSRVTFIYSTLEKLRLQLKKYNTGLKILCGKPLEVWKHLLRESEINKVFYNKDYEPYAINRDKEITDLLKREKVKVFTYKDQVIFEESEVTKKDGKPYTIYTPYKRVWLDKFNDNKSELLKAYTTDFTGFIEADFHFPALAEIGFSLSAIKVKPFTLDFLEAYAETRDFPAKDSTSYLGVHLRFGTISIREIIRRLSPNDEVFLSELIWREFFMQILFHFPYVINSAFKPKYNSIEWESSHEYFELWQQGKTGYPFVDAGMRQLAETGYMHNRVRMVCASFLCKHLLINWQKGEAYFAEKLLDYELSSNNGNWQWAAGTGCDAAPYFRVFNPEQQQKRFDKNFEYIKKWIPEIGTLEYPQPIIDHKFARERALKRYKEALY